MLNTHAQKLTNDNTLLPSKGIVALGRLTLNSGNVDNKQGYMASHSNLTMHVADINNTQGLIKSNQGMNVVAQSAQNNDGVISAKENANISIVNHFAQLGGQLGASHLVFNAGRLSSEKGSLITADSADIERILPAVFINFCCSVLITTAFCKLLISPFVLSND